MPTVLHVLPHRGGGAETYIDTLEGIEGFDHERVFLSSGRTPARAATSLPMRWPAMARRARRADIVHAHGDVAGVLAIPALRGRPSLWTTHGLHFLRRAEGGRRRAAERAVRALVGATRVTLCTSQAEHDELRALVRPGDADRVVHLPNGIDAPAQVAPEQRAAWRTELDLGDDDVALLFLGELEARKAPLDAIAATQRARAEGAPVVLLLAGDGAQADEARRLAGNETRVLGFRTDVQRLLGVADVFVAPAQREGLSFAVLEAMGHGLALVVSDGPGNPEAVGDAGIVVPAGDGAALAAAIGALARDPAERRRLGDAARERVVTRFTAQRLVDGVLDAYRRAHGA